MRLLFIPVYRPAGKELEQRKMERNSDASRTALLTYSHAISSHQDSKHESLPTGCLLGFCSLLQHFSIRVDLRY